MRRMRVSNLASIALTVKRIRTISAHFAEGRLSTNWSTERAHRCDTGGIRFTGALGRGSSC